MKRLLFILLLLFVLLSMSAFGAEEKTFSLQECLAIALKNNITLGIKVVQVERQEGLLKQAKEKFLPALTFQLGKAKTNSPSFSWIEAEGAISAASQQLSGQLTSAKLKPMETEKLNWLLIKYRPGMALGNVLEQVKQIWNGILRDYPFESITVMGEYC